MLKIVVDFTLINPIMKWFVKRCCFCSFWGHLLRFCFAIFHFWGGSPRARGPARARGVFGLVGDLSPGLPVGTEEVTVTVSGH